MRIHTISFRHAIDGIAYVFKTQPNFRFHSFATVVVLLAALLLRVTWLEIIVLLFTIMLVLIAEMLNTSVEAVTDMVTTKQNHYAKISKDVAAGMVLMSACLSAIVGIIIFLPYIFRIIY